MLKSKKERAFYIQSAMVVAYVATRALKPELATFDPHYTTLMMMLATYHVGQAVVDAVEKYKGPK